MSATNYLRGIRISFLFCSIILTLFLGCEDEELSTTPPSPNVPNVPNVPNNTAEGIIGTFPSFPRAEGFGSLTAGGRGGIVIAVTNLNDSGPGSFRHAIETKGPRIIVFHTGGTIRLTESIEILEPFVTIAGQTAPGDGIMFRDADIRIKTHDVVLRGIRIRVGDVNRADDWDGIVLHTPPNQAVYNVIVDHCSVSWAIDENFSTFGLGDEIRDCTFSYNISSEGLEDSHHKDGPHSKGMLLTKNNLSTVSVHHNLFIHNVGRNPKVALDATAEVINNVVYNFGVATRLDPGAKVNAIGNYYIPGPNTSPRFQGQMNKGIMLGPMTGFPEMLLYVKNNIGPGRESDEDDDWLAVGGGDENIHRSLDPVPDFTASGITPHVASDALELVLDHAGAIAPHRDPVDLRLVEDVRSGTGTIINSQEDVGGWPVLDVGEPPTDTDLDGMPDNWETQLGLDPNDASDGNADRDDDGYTNIEEYINSFLIIE